MKPTQLLRRRRVATEDTPHFAYVFIYHLSAPAAPRAEVLRRPLQRGAHPLLQPCDTHSAMPHTALAVPVPRTRAPSISHQHSPVGRALEGAPARSSRDRPPWDGQCGRARRSRRGGRHSAAPRALRPPGAACRRVPSPAPQEPEGRTHAHPRGPGPRSRRHGGPKRRHGIYPRSSRGGRIPAGLRGGGREGWRLPAPRGPEGPGRASPRTWSRFSSLPLSSVSESMRTRPFRFFTMAEAASPRPSPPAAARRSERPGLPRAARPTGTQRAPRMRTASGREGGRGRRRRPRGERGAMAVCAPSSPQGSGFRAEGAPPATSRVQSTHRASPSPASSHFPRTVSH